MFGDNPAAFFGWHYDPTQLHRLSRLHYLHRLDYIPPLWYLRSLVGVAYMAVWTDVGRIETNRNNNCRHSLP